MQRLIPLSVVLTLLLTGIANAQSTTATAVAPATIVTDSSGNLLLVERRAANSIPGAASTATGLVTRVVIVPPQPGTSPSTAVYGGTMSNFYLGKRAIYSIFTVTQGGKTTRSLVAIDAGATGTLQKTLPTVNIANVGTSDIRVVPSAANKDAIYVIQQPTIVRRVIGTTTSTATTNAARTIVIVEFDGTSFSTPRSVTVQ
jgi:hypothetical protein